MTKNPVKVPYLRHIWYMVHRYKYGWLQVITGNPGSGKSWTAITEAEIIDPTFNIDRIGFTPKDYLNVIAELKSGQFAVWDEVGVGISARKWQSASNILITEVLQTMRHRRIGVILVVPDLSFIDVQARKLISSYMECKRYQHHPPELWVYQIKIDRRTGKIYFPHPMIQYNNRTVKLKSFILKRKPSKELVVEYEKKHKAYKRRIEKKARSAVSILETDLGGGKTVFDHVNDVQNDPKKYTNKKGNIDWLLIKAHIGLSQVKAQQVAKLVSIQ